MKKLIFLLPAVLFLAVSCNGNKKQDVSQNQQTNNLPEQSTEAKFDGRLRVDSPKEGDVLGKTFTLSGVAQDWFEGVIVVAVYDGNGKKLLMDTVQISGDNYGKTSSFSKELVLQEMPASVFGRIEFNDLSAKDGSLSYQKLLAIKFNPEIVVSSQSLTVEYKNTQYGFTFGLPESWTGYSIVSSKWEGNVSDAAKGDLVAQQGPIVSIRNPKWTAKLPFQDIPVMVFTLKQWDDMSQDKFHIGAAPLNPSELGRNSKYVFALPARYNFGGAEGVKEVDEIIQTHPLKGF